MWRVTLPYLWRTGRQEWRSVLVVAAGGIMAGAVATSKSLLESGIIQQVANAITNKQTSSVWSRTLERFSSTEEDWASRLTGWLLPGISLREAVIAYLLVSVTGACMAILTTNARESIARSLFARLYEDGLGSAFKNNAAPTVQANEPGGLAGAVQQGARSVSGGYAVLVEALQYVFALATIVVLLVGVPLVGVSRRFAVLCVLLAVIFAAISWIRGRHLAARREEFDEQRRDLFAFTDDVISNRDVLLAHERKKPYVNKLTGTARSLATVGKQCDDVSSRVLVLDLPLDGPAPAARLCAAASGEPVWLSLRALDGEWSAPTGTRVFVCENPTIVEAAADELGSCCPLSCARTGCRPPRRSISWRGSPRRACQ